MKLNWGTGLLIAIIVSSLGILMLVVLSSREKIDLVTEEYYPKELTYEQQIEKLRNTRSLEKAIEIKQRSGNISFYFPRIVEVADSIEGDILFYFPSDKYRDRNKIIRLDTAFSQSFSTKDFKPGKYEVIVEWKTNGVEYMQKELLFLSN